ncbi:MAG: hypothetical protein ACK5ND_08815 [Bacteroides sp.]
MNVGRLIICVFIAGFTITSCNVNQNKVNENKVSDSASISLPKKTEEVGSKHEIFHNDLFSTDSIVGSYHILYKLKESERIFIKKHSDTDWEGDKTISSIHQDVVLTVTKDGKNVILNRKIQIDDSRSFIPENEIVNYGFTSFGIKEVMINQITFYLNYCIPDTDLCYSFEPTFLDNGNLEIKEVIEESDW